MKRFDVEHGSYEWLRLRLGIITASNFHRIITPKTRKPSAQAAGYCNEILAEWLLGEPLDSASSQFMERGKGLEADAVRRFEFDRNCTVDRVGFCLTEDGLVGCSPDGLVDDEEGLEIKVLSAANHVGALLAFDPFEHVCQIQGGMYVTGCKRWTRMYYHPTFPPVYRTIERNDGFIADLHAALQKFLACISEARARLLEQGCVRRLPRDPDAYCRERREDDRFCMRRQGVKKTAAGWRCPEHAEPVPAGAGDA